MAPLKRDVRVQFKRVGNIPRFARNTPEMQSPIPSQDHPQRAPYNPALQPDMKAGIRTTNRPFMTQGEGGNLIPEEMSIVLHTFDSRPPRAFDWYFQDKIEAITSLTPEPKATVLQGYRVPEGYNLFVRKLTVSIYTNGDVTNGNGDNDFALNETPVLAIIVDGSSTPFWTDINGNVAGQALSGVPLFDVYFNDVEIPMFVLVPGGATITAQLITNFAFINGQTFNVYFRYEGNLLLSTGRTLENEVGNDEPLPVTAMG